MKYDKNDFYSLQDVYASMYKQPKKQINENIDDFNSDEIPEFGGSGEFDDITDDFPRGFEASGTIPPEYENKTAERPYPYLIRTYQQDTLKNVDVIWLSSPYIDDPYGDDVPFSLGSNQSLERLH